MYTHAHARTHIPAYGCLIRCAPMSCSCSNNDYPDEDEDGDLEDEVLAPGVDITNSRTHTPSTDQRNGESGRPRSVLRVCVRVCAILRRLRG